MKYKSEDIDFLANNLKIEEVVGEFVSLKKSGANYKGLCPFHQDNNPSFVVSPSKNICKCFVCGAGGNPIKFYADYKKLDFVDAAKELANKYKIPLKEIRGKNSEENNAYYDIMNAAHEYFCEQIFLNSGREALEYLSKRKINPQLIKKNSIGYASNSWNGLYDYLILKGYKEEDILELGLAKKGEKGIYDIFRNRIMFPIYSPSGKIIAFGGRTLEDRKDIPKYINSPETPIFKKGKNLYGIKDRGSNIRKKNYSILMEGYMDVLSAHSYGFDVALAPLGTALTEDQGNLLKGYTNNIILAFDMDEPGKMATERAIFILKNLSFNIRVLHLDGAKDPDEYLKKYGKDEFLKEVKKSLEAFDYLYQVYSKEYNLDDLMSKQKFIERFKEFFQSIENKLEKSLYLDKLSKNLNISLDILEEILIINNKKNRIRKNLEIDQPREILEKESKTYDLEELTLAIVISRVEYLKLLKNKPIKLPIWKKVSSYLEFLEENNKSIQNNTIIKDIIKLGILTEEEQEKLIGISMIALNDYNKEVDIKKGITEILSSWFSLELKEALKDRQNIMRHLKLRKIDDELKRIDGNMDKIQALYSEFINLIES
ncbi:DNA primase [Cetobacterium sp. SF1]|uniref:DNA primase n=1 Tax=unclassified Cetobacterium TaxID=2630983 RepID=UPI003CE9D4EF